MFNLGLRRLARMQDLIKLDYMGDEEGIPSTASNVGVNILCNANISKLLTKGGGWIVCACGSKYSIEITGLNVAKLLDGSCPNPCCEYYGTDIGQAKTNHFWPSNVLPVYTTLVNDYGWKG